MPCRHKEIAPDVRRKTRKRGVSIENVMLGLIIVLIFAGLLYGAFTVVNRHMERQALQRDMRIILLEGARIAHRGGNLGYYINQSGMVPPSMQDPSSPSTIALPHDGYAVISNYAPTPGALSVMMLWDEPNRGSIALCNYFAGGHNNGASDVSTPLGSGMDLMMKDCENGMLMTVVQEAF